MGKPSTLIAAVQFAALTDAQRIKLAAEVFGILEYDENGDPGNEWSSDTTQALGELFGRYGVRFTDPNDIPSGYRFSNHTDDAGRFCRWSLVSVVEPSKRADRGDVRCPAKCAASVVEVDPHARLDDECKECNECGALIPIDASDVVNDAHVVSCSLYSSNTVV